MRESQEATQWFVAEIPSVFQVEKVMKLKPVEDGWKRFVRAGAFIVWWWRRHGETASYDAAAEEAYAWMQWDRINQAFAPTAKKYLFFTESALFRWTTHRHALQVWLTIWMRSTTSLRFCFSHNMNLPMQPMVQDQQMIFEPQKAAH